MSVTTVGPTWGSSITNDAIKALIIFFIVVGIYISIRFEPKMALAAFIAMVHDVAVAVGIYSIFNFQVTPDTVVAILTILGYSLYDTVVVFDRVRDNTRGIGTSGRLTYPQLINLSMNQTLARSINTSAVAILPVLAVLLIGAQFLGASTLQSYGLALFVGLLSGAYSSIFIASPVLCMMKEREPRWIDIANRLAKRGDSGAFYSAVDAATLNTQISVAAAGQTGRGAGVRLRPLGRARPSAAASSGRARAADRGERRDGEQRWWRHRHGRNGDRRDGPAVGWGLRVVGAEHAAGRGRARRARASGGAEGSVRAPGGSAAVSPGGYPGWMVALTRVTPTNEQVAEGADGQTEALADLLAPLLAEFAAHRPEDDTSAIVEAGRSALRAHEGQFRRSGEPYITHPVAVATIVAELGLDEQTVAAALLHDAVEDTGLTLADIRAQFGDGVAGVVDGVTKLDRLQFDSKEAQQAATIRKMLVAMADDWRVLLIKLADRLHNMRTLAVMPEWKQRRTAQETFDVYAPLAHRLGVQQVRWQLEDLAFATLHPKRYAEIEQMVAARAPQREEYLEKVLVHVRERLTEMGIEADVTGRPKHMWSIYEKMVVRGKEFDDINDLVAIRVVVESEKDCWAALGAIHAIWAPVHGRFKDYINTPKFNMYQSLHTTVIGLEGKPVEVQIRTSEMHHRAEYGIAAHWGYKSKEDHSSEMAWLQRIADVDRQTDDPIEFLEALKLDLEQDEVYVFTPKGKVIALPARSTPVDFAYAIHTEVGHRFIGARVNGRLVPLETPALVGRHRGDHHVQGADGGAVAGLAPDRRLDPGPQQDPPVVLPGAARGRDRERARRV